MPFNGSGTFNLPAGNPVVVNTTIDAAVHNNTNNEIATALSNCVTRDGQSPPTASLPMGGFKLTGLGAGSGNGESVRYEQTTLKTSATGSAILPARTTTQRNVDTPALGYVGYNTSTGQFEGYGASGWGTLGGGAVGGGTDKVFYENDTIVTQPWVVGSDALISGATFTNGSATIGFTAHGMVVGSRVMFQTTGTLPTNFAINTGYYVVSVPTADTLTVSATMGGTAITAGSAGTGTHSMGKLKNTMTTGPVIINALTTIPARWVIV